MKCIGLPDCLKEYLLRSNSSLIEARFITFHLTSELTHLIAFNQQFRFYKSINQCLNNIFKTSFLKIQI